MNTFFLFIGLAFSPTPAVVWQQPVPAAKPARPENRTAASPIDTIGRRRNAKPRVDSLRRGGISRIDSVRGHKR